MVIIMIFILLAGLFALAGFAIGGPLGAGAVLVVVLAVAVVVRVVAAFMRRESLHEPRLDDLEGDDRD